VRDLFKRRRSPDKRITPLNPRLAVFIFPHSAFSIGRVKLRGSHAPLRSSAFDVF